jgi:hypothetical protein
MQSIQNLINFLDQNWTFIIIVLSFGFSLYKLYLKWNKLSKQEKIDQVIVIVGEIILEKLACAEEDWNNYKKTGSIKRSKVINEIYEQYPILKEYADQEYVIKKIDELIDLGLKDIEKTIKEIKEKQQAAAAEG